MVLVCPAHADTDQTKGRRADRAAACVKCGNLLVDAPTVDVDDTGDAS